MPEPLYVVVGTGAIALRHSRLLRARGRLVVHVRRFGTTTGPDLEGAPIVASLQEAFSLKPLACVVATAAADHIATACLALGKNLDVLVEKPLAETVTSTKPLVDLAADSPSLVMVAYCLRFRSALVRLRREAAEGRIGRLLGFRAAVGQFLPDWRPGRDYRETASGQRALGGGALLELSHEVDLALSILGPALGVSARTARRSDLEIDVEDTADILIEHEGGAFSNLHLDMTDRAANRACRLVGAEGTLDWNQDTGDLRLFRPGEGWSTLEKEEPGAGALMYEEQLSHFEDCRKRRVRPSPSLEDGVLALLVVDAARRSEATGQKVML